MRTFFVDVTAQMKGIWARLEGPQRLVVGAVLLATLIGLGAVIWFAGRPSYEVVYSAANGDDLRLAEQALGRDNITFVPGDGGMTLLVDRADSARALAALRRTGLGGEPSAELDVGGSLIEDAATKQWRLDSVSRQQAEIAIAKLDGVAGVTVTASRPRRVLAFRSRHDEEKASATVLLQLRPGASWDDIAKAAASIAASQLMVPKENIDIVSATGGRRWRYDADRDAGGSSSEFRKMERAISTERTMLAQDLLDRLWPGKTEVRITVELDPSWEIRSEKVLPEGTILRSEDMTKDASDTPAMQADGPMGKSKNEQRKREFVTEIGERRVGKMAPEVRRVSVALFYDVELEGKDGFDRKGLEESVKAIAGWDEQRDTQFSTLSSTFDPLPELTVETTGPGVTDVALQWAPMVGQVLGVIVVVMFLRGLFKRTSPVAVADPEEPKELAEEDLTPDEQQKRMRREIERSIAQDPAALAKMLEAWLIEQKA